jgi:hypothetical protein
MGAEYSIHNLSPPLEPIPTGFQEQSEAGAPPLGLVGAQDHHLTLLLPSSMVI